MQKYDKNKASKHYKNIDCLKGICIIFIIITHFHWSGAERLNLFFPFWIDMAVPVFMVISGFVYTKSFVRHHYSSIDDCLCPDVIVPKAIRLDYSWKRQAGGSKRHNKRDYRGKSVFTEKGNDKGLSMWYNGDEETPK